MTRNIILLCLGVGLLAGCARPRPPQPVEQPHERRPLAATVAADDAAAISFTQAEYGKHPSGLDRVARWLFVDLRDEAAEQKILGAITPKAVFGQTVQEMIAEGHMQRLDFAVLFNRHHVLSLRFDYRGAGADARTEYRTFDLRSGEELAPEMVFTDVAALSALVDRDLQAAIGASPDGALTGALLDGRRFEPAHLARFSVSDGGVTFHHPGFALPGATALAPPLSFTYRFDQLLPFIKRQTALEQVAASASSPVSCAGCAS